MWNGVDYHSPVAGDRYPSINSSGIDEYLINGAGHHWDSYGILDVMAEPDFIREAHLWEIRTVRRWLDAFTVRCLILDVERHLLTTYRMTGTNSRPQDLEQGTSDAHSLAHGR